MHRIFAWPKQALRRPAWLLIRETVEPRGVGAKELVARRRRQLANVIIDQPEHFFIAGGEQADRPIRTVHQAILAERLEHEVEVRFEVVSFPVRVVGLGDHAGDLAENIS